MANRRELVVEQLHALADDLEELWKAATRDPAAERRKQRGWLLLTGALGAVATMASRKALAKLWPILTGERGEYAVASCSPLEHVLVFGVCSDTACTTYVQLRDGNLASECNDVWVGRVVP